MAKLSNPQAANSNECNDSNNIHDQVNTQLRQQKYTPPTHIEAISAGIIRYPQVNYSIGGLHERANRSDQNPNLIPFPSTRQKVGTRQHRVVSISRNTLSAILYAVEEALRSPYSFTPDILEETASMSDLAAAYHTVSRQARENELNRPTTASSSLAGIKGPREVMRERNAREARRKVELEQKEALERIRAAEEAIHLDERRKNTERKTAAIKGEVHDGPARSSSRASQSYLPVRPREASRNRNVSAPARDYNIHRNATGEQPGPGEETRSSRSHSRQPDDQAKIPSSNPSRASNHQAPRPTSTAPATRSTFPHAFERWETLSAHWEGLTSFWIRRLEENVHDIERDPLLQQLSRQVTDLSAAGANLFHAVVELQRLRASSERKFQRWFFEARTEQERHKEIQATIQRKLQAESQAREAAIEEAASSERERMASEKKLAEIKRELQISKEEAKRAWEELGRRELDERVRTTSLRDGLPTVVGGVQVVPMITGVSSRPATIQREKYTVAPPETSGDNYGPSDSINSNEDSSRLKYEVPETYRERPGVHRSPKSSIPSVSNPDAPSRQASRNIASPFQTQSTMHTAPEFHQQVEGTSRLPQHSQYNPLNTGEGYSDEEQEDYATEGQDQFSVDKQGEAPVYMTTQDYSSDMDVPKHYSDDNVGLTQYAQLPEVEYSRSSLASTAYAHMPALDMASDNEIDAADLHEFSRQGYTPAPGWTEVPRHHHPTRLSDVMEEDERSRTSASQISRSRE